MNIDELCVLINALTPLESFTVHSCVNSNIVNVGTLTGSKGTVIKIVTDKGNKARFLVTNDTRRSNYNDVVNSLRILCVGEIIDSHIDNNDY